MLADLPIERGKDRGNPSNLRSGARRRLQYAHGGPGGAAFKWRENHRDRLDAAEAEAEEGDMLHIDAEEGDFIRQCQEQTRQHGLVLTAVEQLCIPESDTVYPVSAKRRAKYNAEIESMRRSDEHPPRAKPERKQKVRESKPLKSRNRASPSKTRIAAFNAATPARKKEIEMWQCALKASGGSLGAAAAIYETQMADSVSGY